MICLLNDTCQFFAIITPWVMKGAHTHGATANDCDLSLLRRGRHLVQCGKTQLNRQCKWEIMTMI